jgi:uncharacterized membrane protein
LTAVDPEWSLVAGEQLRGEMHLKSTICVSVRSGSPPLRRLFVAPSPGPVILINRELVIQTGLDARERYAVLHRATPERISRFSDGVFAVLITVLVFNLRPPELPTFGALLLLWPTWLSYAMSYLFIAIVWINHQYLIRYATEANLRLLWFNFAHLFAMSLLLLSTAWMANSELAPQPVAFYAAVFFLVNAIYICLIWELIDRIPFDQPSLTVRKVMRVRSITTLCLFGGRLRL